MSQLGWLEGCWESTADELTVSECWLRDGEALQGQGRMDDRVYETAVIGPTEEGPRYVVRKTNGTTTTFVVTQASESIARFENPENTGPTWIQYRRDGEDIVGSVGTGSEPQHEWRFHKR